MNVHGWMDVDESQRLHLHCLSLLARLSTTSWRQLLLYHYELPLRSFSLESHFDKAEPDTNNIFCGLSAGAFERKFDHSLHIRICPECVHYYRQHRVQILSFPANSPEMSDLILCDASTLSH